MSSELDYEASPNSPEIAHQALKAAFDCFPEDREAEETAVKASTSKALRAVEKIIRDAEHELGDQERYYVDASAPIVVATAFWCWQQQAELEDCNPSSLVGDQILGLVRAFMVREFRNYSKSLDNDELGVI
jgi:hypothetical protein